jgi:hypothetical protein
LAREIAEADYSGKGTVSSLEFVASRLQSMGDPVLSGEFSSTMAMPQPSTSTRSLPK